MERRCKILDDMGVNKLHSMPLDKRPFPLMIIIVDELADPKAAEQYKTIKTLFDRSDVKEIICATDRGDDYCIILQML